VFDVHSKFKEQSSNMPTQKTRSRMISVRFSEEEYANLRGMCAVTGAPSVSALTRDAVRIFMSAVNHDEVFVGRMDEYRAHINKLNQKLEDLSQTITSIKPDVFP